MKHDMQLGELKKRLHMPAQRMIEGETEDEKMYVLRQ